MEAPYYYLKVTPKKAQSMQDLDSIINTHALVKRRPQTPEKVPRDFVFGTLTRILYVKEEYAVLRADTELRDHISYSKNSEALKAAIKYLENRGYKTREFDLEHYLESI